MTTDSCIHLDSAKWRLDNFDTLMMLSTQLLDPQRIPPSAEGVMGSGSYDTAQPFARWFVEGFLTYSDPLYQRGRDALSLTPDQLETFSTKKAIYALQLALFMRQQAGLTNAFRQERPKAYAELQQSMSRKDIYLIDLMATLHTEAPSQLSVLKTSPTAENWIDYLADSYWLVMSFDVIGLMPCYVDPHSMGLFNVIDDWRDEFPEFVPVFYAIIADGLWMSLRSEASS